MKTFSINCRGKLLTTVRPLVMGILNVTPDSFYDGGRYCDSEGAILSRAEQIINEGADIIDIGACSTRPGGELVEETEEWRRLNLALEVLSNHMPEAVISVDTFRSEVARRAIDKGASIINDVSSGDYDGNMFKTISELNVTYVLTHSQNCQIHSKISREVITALSHKMKALTELGVNDVIIDPGFGFGKTLDDNYKLLSELSQLQIFDKPILVGVSRKSMIYKLLSSTPEESLNGTTVINTMALMAGANILRVHDVKPCVETVRIFCKTHDID